MSFGPASPDAGVELLRQLFLQCMVYTPPPPGARTPGINGGEGGLSHMIKIFAARNEDSIVGLNCLL